MLAFVDLASHARTGDPDDVHESLIYHAFGIRGYTHVRTEYVGGAVCFHLREPAERWRRSRCGERKVIRRGLLPRTFRGVPIGKKPVWISLEIGRVECKRCGAVRQVEVPFAEGQRRYTKAFERYALELLRHMTISDVAVHLGVSWDGVKEILKRDLKKRYTRPLARLRLVAISTGPLEGTNNTIKTLQRQACGLSDREFFKVRICALPETRYALVG